MSDRASDFYELARSDAWRFAMTDDPGPIEDDLEDPAKQDPSPDLPSPLEGNEDEDDMEEPEDGAA